MAVERVRRVLVALDGIRADEAILRALSSLLDPEQLEMTGLYVEDEDLLRAARLPCFREISFSGRPETVDAGSFARGLAGEAAAARHAFEELAEHLTGQHRRPVHRFTVVRGRMAEEVGRAAAEADLVLVTRRLRGAGFRQRVGRSFAGLVRQPRHVLLVNEPWASGSAVVVVNAGDLALNYGRRLAQAERLRLVIANPVAAPLPGREGLPAGTVVRQLTRWEEEDIAELCLSEDARVLVLAQIPNLDWAELLISLMDRLPCSVLKLAEPVDPARG